MRIDILEQTTREAVIHNRPGALHLLSKYALECRKAGVKECSDYAEMLAQISYQTISDTGFCLWECSKLEGDIIAIVLDEMTLDYLKSKCRLPKYSAIYTLQEIETLAGKLPLVYEAKKHGGMVAT